MTCSKRMWASKSKLRASFAAGYGAVTGDYGLAADGTGTAYSAVNQASAANCSLDQIKQCFEALSKRRTELLKDLD